ncbi:xanthine dehydrogenase FAD-binding subunit XdhB [bacterium]|nr:xanthine dehydrogenase FAD-binding subunit XdhB [bacterium]
MFQLKTYEKAESITNAIELLTANPKSRLIAGGTDVLIRLRDGKAEYEHLVDIHDLEELRQCGVKDDGTLVIGPGTTFTQLIKSDVIRKNIPILAEAAGTVGGPQVRNVATVGGNICNGVTSADSASTLFALNAILTIDGADGQRQIAISDFYKGPGKVDLKQGEILTSIIITPDNYQGYFGHYHKYAMRNAMDIATIGCAAICKIEGDRLVDLRLAYGVAAPVPIRCGKTESMVSGRKLTEKLLADITASVKQDVNPRTSWRASKEFRLQIISELAGRVVRKTVENAGGSFQ